VILATNKLKKKLSTGPVFAYIADFHIFFGIRLALERVHKTDYS